MQSEGTQQVCVDHRPPLVGPPCQHCADGAENAGRVHEHQWGRPIPFVEGAIYLLGSTRA